MNNILLTILSVSVSGSILSLLIFLIKPLIKNRVSKAFSYYIWLLVLLRLVLPFGYNFSIPGASPLFAGTGVQSVTTSAVDGKISSDAISNGQTGRQSDGNGEVVASGDSENKNLPTAAATPATGNSPGFWGLVRANMFYVWLAGAIGSLCWFATAYILFSRKLSRSFEAPQEDDLTVFKKMTRGEKVRLVCSRQINTPMLMGVFHPVVVLPQLAYTANGMGSEFFGILRHELTHYHRRDIVYKWLVVFVTSLHWFNPLVYLIRREIGDACELSCDEAVIKRMTISERKYYGNTLLALAAKRRIPSGAMATTLCQGKKQLKGRLLSIMNYKKKTHAAVAFMIILTLVLTGCSVGVASFDSGKAAADQDSSSSAIQEEQTNNLEKLSQSSAASDKTSVTSAPDKTSTASSPDEDSEKQGSAQSSWTASIAEVYKAVLQGNAEFFSVDTNKNLSINQLNQAVSDDSSVTATATKFAIVDLDSDGTPEVVLWLNVNNDDYYGFEVLRYQDGVVYGYTLWYRSFMDLKENGTFSFSGGAADSGFGKMEFTGNTYSIDKITYSESSYDSENNMSVSYFVDHESATEEEFLSAISRQSEAAAATWYDFTNDNIAAMFK